MYRWKKLKQSMKDTSGNLHVVLIRFNDKRIPLFHMDHDRQNSNENLEMLRFCLRRMC